MTFLPGSWLLWHSQLVFRYSTKTGIGKSVALDVGRRASYEALCFELGVICRKYAAEQIGRRLGPISRRHVGVR